jgi:hypothetical protein
MTADNTNEAARRKVAEGMSEAGKGVTPKGGTGPAKTPKPPDEVAKGMSKSGSGEATGASSKTR